MDFTNDLEKVEGRAEELKDAFLVIQQPRTDFALTHFVVGEYDTPERQYMQVVEELRRAYQMIKISMLEKKKLQIEIKKLKASKDEISKLDAQIKEVHEEDLDATILGKLREFHCLYAIFNKFKKYTREELDKAEANYWKIRLTRQAAEDVMAHGNIGAGNIEALREIGIIQPPTLQTKEGPNGSEIKVSDLQLDLDKLNARDFSKCNYSLDEASAKQIEQGDNS